MENDIEQEEPSDTVKDVMYIASVLNDATKYGLQAEVVAWALFGLKGNPEMSAREAIDYGHDEWVK